MTDSAGFVGGSGLSSARVVEGRRSQARLAETKGLIPNSIEIKVWAALFGLLILAIIILIILVMTEGSAHATAPPGDHLVFERPLKDTSKMFVLH